MIDAWRLDLTRILHTFNVRSLTSLLTLLTIRFQTELALHTHGAVFDIRHDVMDTHNMVYNIHRAVVERQEGVDGGNQPVSNRCARFIVEQIPTAPQTQIRSETLVLKEPASYVGI